MPAGWEWDETLYRGSAPFYAHGRPPYAPGLSDRLTEALGLDGVGLLLDVGCGPGTVALQLADRVGLAVGVDADSGMLVEAARGARAAEIANAHWVRARGEALPFAPGAVRVALFAQSFHWMDRERVAAAVRTLLAPGGALVLIADVKEPPPDVALPHPRPPYEAIRSLVRRYLGPLPRAGQGVLRHGSPGDEEAVLARAGFAGPQRLRVPAAEPLLRDEDAVVAWVYSLSGSAPHLFGEALPAFEAELHALLRETAPDGRFADPPADTDVRVWRLPSA